MPKVTLETIASGVGTTTLHNSNFQAIEQAFENTISRDGSSPNQMQAPLDMNGYSILNLGNPFTINGFVWEGTWIADRTYSVGDVVHHNGNAYISILENSNQAPPNSTYWQIVASSGITDANDIPFLPQGGGPATTVQSGIYSVEDVANSAAGSITSHIASASAHDAAAIVVTPSGNLSATNAQAAVQELQTDIDNRLSLSGGTLTGALALHADPTNPLEAVTKQYADALTGSDAGTVQVIAENRRTIQNVTTTYTSYISTDVVIEAGDIVNVLGSVLFKITTVSGATYTLGCRLVVDGVTIWTNNQAIIVAPGDRESVTIPVAGQVTGLAAGTRSVSLNIYTDTITVAADAGALLVIKERT